MLAPSTAAMSFTRSWSCFVRASSSTSPIMMNPASFWPFTTMGVVSTVLSPMDAIFCWIGYLLFFVRGVYRGSSVRAQRLMADPDRGNTLSASSNSTPSFAACSRLCTVTFLVVKCSASTMSANEHRSTPKSGTRSLVDSSKQDVSSGAAARRPASAATALVLRSSLRLSPRSDTRVTTSSSNTAASLTAESSMNPPSSDPTSTSMLRRLERLRRCPPPEEREQPSSSLLSEPTEMRLLRLRGLYFEKSRSPGRGGSAVGGCGSCAASLLPPVMHDRSSCLAMPLPFPAHASPFEAMRESGGCSLSASWLLPSMHNPLSSLDTSFPDPASQQLQCAMHCSSFRSYFQYLAEVSGDRFSDRGTEDAGNAPLRSRADASPFPSPAHVATRLSPTVPPTNGSSSFHPSPFFVSPPPMSRRWRFFEFRGASPSFRSRRRHHMTAAAVAAPAAYESAAVAASSVLPYRICK
mmetsp:Transcript_37057/g.111005  ORF Transcript_37057/g.111005 Transcript_37057/m.111005 type:complete len:466 (-) Transcript_37057:20-1417(-)